MSLEAKSQQQDRSYAAISGIWQKGEYSLLNLEPKFEVTELKLQIPHLPESFEGYKMVHITDLHLGVITPDSHLDECFKILSEMNPNLVFVTGDFVQTTRTDTSKWLGNKIAKLCGKGRESRVKHRADVVDAAISIKWQLRSVKPSDGYVGVPGNHEYKEGYRAVVGQLTADNDGPIHFVHNDIYTVRKGIDELRIIGLDDYDFGDKGKDELFLRGVEILDKNDKGTKVPTILLAHNPDSLSSVSKEAMSRIDLALCGHTHGGQFCLPGGFPIITNTRKSEHVKGLGVINNTPVYVSNGVGFGVIPIRMWCPPEIVVITLNRMVGVRK